jgi:comEA protein
MRIFTPQERFTILFLVFLLVLGTSLYLYKLNHPSFAPAYTIKDFDKKMNPVQQSSEPVNYNLPLPDEQIERAFEKKPLPTKKVNINVAAEAELAKLPGIGPVYAQRIVAYREKHGAFQSIQEIKKIRGIGEKTFLKMKHYLTIE